MSGTATVAPVVGVRQKRWRQRQKVPVRVVGRVEYERDVVVRALIHTFRLSQAEAGRRDLVERALSTLIAEWAIDRRMGGGQSK
jgi:hypothetical protein